MNETIRIAMPTISVMICGENEKAEQPAVRRKNAVAKALESKSNSWNLFIFGRGGASLKSGVHLLGHEESKSIGRGLTEGIPQKSRILFPKRLRCDFF